MHFRSEAGALILVSPKFSIAFPGPGPILILSLPRHLPPFYSGKYKYRFDEKYHRDLLTNTNTDFDNKYRHQFSGIYSLVRLVMPNTEELISQPLEGL